MKLTKFFLLALIALVLPLSSCEDREIYFTTDEIVGDIITGNQIRMNNPTIISMGTIKVNVQNAKGNVTATSSDQEIADVEVYKSQYRYPELIINLKKQGDVSISVKDEDGNTATLCFKVRAGGLLPDTKLENE